MGTEPSNPSARSPSPPRQSAAPSSPPSSGSLTGARLESGMHSGNPSPRGSVTREPARASRWRSLDIGRWGYPLVFVAAVLLAWEGAVAWFGLPHYILPAPSLVAATLVEKWPVFLFHTAVTMSEVGMGALLGISGGLVLGLLMFFYQPLEKALYPLLIVSQNIPVFAVAPLLVVWFGYGYLSKIVMAAVIIFFPITVSVLDGLKRTDADQIRLFRTMNATQAQILWKLRFPAALPALFSGLKLSAIYSTIGAVIGEWVGAGAGLGYLMLSANAQLRVAEVFGAIFCLTPIGLGMLGLVVLAERWCIPWQHISRDYRDGYEIPQQS